MMIRNRIVLKSVALFFAIQIFSSAVIPTVSYALTSGPTAPEATSFEPVDTTDMVNITAGELAYNLPLLEVPGPAGGYPLSLSYHAGLYPSEEASWVGLGWTLNPGSLTRITNGMADDLNGSKTVTRSFWEGGERTTYTVGVSVGISNCASVGYGLEFSNDTYQGRTTGGYGTLALGYSKGEGHVGVSATYGSDGYGSSYSSFNAGAGYGDVSVGASYSGGELSGSIGVEYEGMSMDASISSDGIEGSVGVKGAKTSIYNSKEGKISTSGSNNSVDIPIYFVNIHLGYRYTRYWSDESQDTYTYGSLFQPQFLDPSFFPECDKKAFDTYSIPDPTNDQVTYAHVDLEKQLGGTFADYDSYQVNAQGVGGAIRPYHYWVTLAMQNRKKDDQPYLIKNYTAPQNNYTAPEFRFINDFANKLRYNEPDITVVGPDAYGGKRIQFNTTTAVVGHTSTPTTLPSAPGSKSIQYFTNHDIQVNATALGTNKGFLECKAQGFDRASLVADGNVGAFRVTNATGVTYHFSLPAYTYDEYTYSANISDTDGDTFNSLAQPNKYAYTWYLTAVTGPDYVDRNGNLLADAGDWGYWVAFEYGKWTEAFRWRNPGEGYHKDLDPNFQNFSKGKKELYYLNAIKTASHTAYFVKELRWDGKSSNPDQDVPAAVSSDHHISYQDAGLFADHQVGGVNYYAASQLRLKSIHLFQNKDVIWPTLEQRSTGYTYTNGTRWHEYGGNVIDVKDIEGIESSFTSKAVRSIEFYTDYSLCPGTTNSFISGADQTLTNNGQSATLLGKLTLNSIKFRGHGGGSAIPDMKFEYDLNDRQIIEVPATLSGTDELILDATNFADIRNSYKIGDLVCFVQSGSSTTKYGYLKTITGNSYKIKGIDGTVLSNSRLSWIKRTKNAPYKKEFTDMWGSYKVDYVDIAQSNLSKITSKWSAPNVDVWSLRKIKTQLGSDIRINYESDTYSTSAYGLNHSLPTQSIGLTSYFIRPGTNAATFRLHADFNAPGTDLRDFFTPNQIADFWGLFVFQVNNCPSCKSPVYMEKAKLINVNANSMDIEYESTFPYDPAQYTFTGYGGNLFFKYDDRNYGGGIRVSSVSIYEPLSGKTRETAYQYEFIDVNQKSFSSGVTSYEPVYHDYCQVDNAPAAFADDYKRKLRRQVDDIMRLARFLPAPTVIYQKVRVNENVYDRGVSTPRPIRGYKEYEFEVFQKSLVDSKIESDVDNQPQSGNAMGLDFSSVSLRKITTKDYSSRVGALKKITSYSADGVKMSEIEHKYLHDQNPASTFAEHEQKYEPLLTQFDEQGVIDESFDHARLALKITDYEILGLISRRQTFPTIELGTIERDYKNGTVSETSRLKFDMLSGQTLQSLSSDGYGNDYLTEVLPAYKVYSNMSQKNMLMQNAATTIYKIGDRATLTKTGVAAATAQTWSETIPVLTSPADGARTVGSGIWRKQAEYKFVGDKQSAMTNDGILPMASYSAFDFTNLGTNTKWDKNSEITLHDVFSREIEGKDFNGIYSAAKMSHDQSRVVATGTNSLYKELAYSGAEDAEQLVSGKRIVGQGVSTTGTVVSTAHTGTKGISASTSTRAFQYAFAPQTKTYRVSVWASATTATIKYQVGSGTVKTATLAPVKTAGTWNLFVADIPSTASSTLTTIWCQATSSTVVFDDFRVHPVDAAVTTYVYNDYGDVSHILDNNNLFTYFKYDAMGRLIEVQKESFQYGVKKLSEYTYNFGTN